MVKIALGNNDPNVEKKARPTSRRRKRAELTVPHSLDIAQCSRGRYRFSAYLPRGSIFTNSERPGTAYVIAQWKGHNSRSPALAVRLTNKGKLAVTVDNDAKRTTIYQGPIPYDQLTQFDFAVDWSPNQSGRVFLSLNGKQVASFEGPVGYGTNGPPGAPERQGYYFKYGLYNPNRFEFPEGKRSEILLGAYYHRQENGLANRAS